MQSQHFSGIYFKNSCYLPRPVPRSVAPCAYFLDIHFSLQIFASLLDEVSISSQSVSSLCLVWRLIVIKVHFQRLIVGRPGEIYFLFSLGAAQPVVLPVTPASLSHSFTHFH